MASLPEFAADSVSASGRSAVLSLSALRPKMKSDPEGYTTELSLIYNQFKSSLELFHQQSAMSFSSLSSGISIDSTVSSDLSARVEFLAHVTPFYPKELAQYPNELVQFLQSSPRNLPSGLRKTVTEALKLLSNRKFIDIADILVLFMELQTLEDKVLKDMAFSHIIDTIKRMNQKHKNDPKNKALQTILFRMLQQEDEAKAKRALITLCTLHKKRLWCDERTANAICLACFHPSQRIMIATLSFLLDFEKIEDDESDDSDSEDEAANHSTQVALSKEAIYKASHKGTTSSKKKKQAKLQRVARSLKRQQRLSSEKNCTNYNSPLNHLKDAQGFAEKLFSRLQNNARERFEVKMMLLKVIARTIGLHHLILWNFYDYLKNYIKPHQRDVTQLLAAAVQACHDMVPPEAVEPLFKQVVNEFVNDKSRPEAISVGLNVVREICLRMPLLMTEELLQELVLFRKSHEKAVSASARSLLTLFREICPSLLVKKDRGRPADPKARPKAFGEVHVASSVPGIELLEEDNEENEDEDSDGVSSDGDIQDSDDDLGSLFEVDGSGPTNDASELESIPEMDDESAASSEEDEVSVFDGDEYGTDDNDMSDEEENENDSDDELEDSADKKAKSNKRKFPDFEEQIEAASTSLHALKRLAGTTGNVSSDPNHDGILSNEDFQRIKERKAKMEANTVLAQHGFKVPNSDQLSTKRVDAAILEANIKKKFTKDEKLALMRASREERGKYQARTAIKQKKTGGTSNRQKEHKKAMPLAAKRSKIAKTRMERKKTKRRASTQFRGRKAWKS